jgi:hypothetical protein
MFTHDLARIGNELTTLCLACGFELLQLRMRLAWPIEDMQMPIRAIALR